jgi:hypothetical protein
MAYLNYGGSRNTLVLQTPSLPSPFGLSVFDKSGPPKYSVDLAMRGYQDNAKVKVFYDALSALDEHMIDLGVKNSKLWFKSDMKRELVSAFYTPCVRFGKDKDGNQTNYPPTLKIKLMRNREGTDFECQFYDQKSKGDPHAQPLKGVPIEEMLVRKVELTGLIQCTSVWFAGGKFGLSWKAVQMRLDSVPMGIGRTCAIEEEDGEAATDAAEFSRPSGAKAALADDDDAEAEAEEETAQSSQQQKRELAESEDDETQVAPVPVPRSKTVVTKSRVLKAAVKK